MMIVFKLNYKLSMDPNIPESNNQTAPPQKNGSFPTIIIIALLIFIAAGIAAIFLPFDKINLTSLNSNKSTILEKPDCTFSFGSLDAASKNIGKVCILSLSNQNLNTLPADLNKFVNLKSISIAGNNFTQLPSVILSVKTLESLDINRTKITSLPSNIKELKELQYLYADSLTSIPKELRLLTKLKRLYIKKALVPESEVEDLRKSNPNIEIMFAKEITEKTIPSPTKTDNKPSK